jgi:hypothetical protein
MIDKVLSQAIITSVFVLCNGWQQSSPGIGLLLSKNHCLAFEFMPSSTPRTSLTGRSTATLGR